MEKMFLCGFAAGIGITVFLLAAALHNNHLEARCRRVCRGCGLPFNPERSDAADKGAYCSENHETWDLEHSHFV